jgi:type VI protein secretion system component VasF
MLFYKTNRRITMTQPGSNPDQLPTQSKDAPRHKTPFWVKGFLVAAAVLVVAFAVMHLSGGMVMNHTP